MRFHALRAAVALSVIVLTVVGLLGVFELGFAVVRGLAWIVESF